MKSSISAISLSWLISFVASCKYLDVSAWMITHVSEGIGRRVETGQQERLALCDDFLQ
jgi:hypothetical protein